MSEINSEKNQQKFRELKTWRETAPSKKSQGRFPSWVRDYIIEILPEIGVLRLSSELSIGQRTILRWARESNSAMASKVDEQPLETYLGEEALNETDVKNDNIKITLQYDGMDLNATLSKDQLERILKILF